VFPNPRSDLQDEIQMPHKHRVKDKPEAQTSRNCMWAFLQGTFSKTILIPTRALPSTSKKALHPISLDIARTSKKPSCPAFKV
jgi:hypothetical protein